MSLSKGAGGGWTAGGQDEEDQEDEEEQTVQRIEGDTETVWEC